MTADESLPPPGAFRRRLLHNTAATAAANGWTMLLAIASLPLLPAAFDVPHELRSAVRFAAGVFAIQVFFELVASGAGACLDGLQRIDLSRLADAGRRTVVAAATAITALQGGGLQGVAVASA